MPQLYWYTLRSNGTYLSCPLNYYRLLTKLREGNVFTPVSLSTGGGGMMIVLVEPWSTVIVT